jgi:hypothetical protein
MMLMPWGRVGSNLLFAILRQSASMKLANENLIQLSTAEQQTAWFKDFYEVSCSISSQSYIGSKQNLRSVRDFAALQRMIGEYAVRVIRLRRDNHVKSAISQIRAEMYAEQTRRDTGTAMWAVKKGSNPLGPSVVDSDLLLKRIQIMAEWHSKLVSTFAGHEVLDIEYEEINGSLEETVRRLQSFLDLPHGPFRVTFDKATPDNLAETVLNFGEIRDRLAGTPYEPMTT